MNSDVQIVKLSQVYLDLENPRHDPFESEPEVIAHLLKDEAVKVLAKHIATVGSLSPLEIVGLIPHPIVKDAYVPAEGNRRVCALKLLDDPDRAPTESDRKYFRTLKDAMDRPIKTMSTRIFRSKAEARPWISLRHEGEQGGVGTKKWDSTQKSRFNMEGSERATPNEQAIKLLDYAVARGLISDEERGRLALTTMTRFLSNPVFRDTLGLHNNRDLQITVASSEFDSVVRRFLHDARDPSSGVNSRTTVDERRQYATILRQERSAPTTRNLPPTPASPSQPAERAPGLSISMEPSNRPKRNNRGREHDTTVIPSSFKAHIDKKTVLKRLYDELSTLDAGSFTFSAAYLLRAVIEQATVQYLKQQCKGSAIPKELHMKIAALEKQLEVEGVDDRCRKPLRVMATNKDSSGSPDTLGNFVHGGAIPSKHDVFRTWDNIAPAMSYVFTKLK